MKIMHVFITMPVGGAEDLALSLMRAAPAGAQVEAVCLRDPGVAGSGAQAAGMAVHTLPLALRKQYSLLGMWRFSRWLKSQCVDVVHSHVYNSHQYSVPAARLAGIPCVLHHHKTFNPKRLRRWFILRLLSRYAARHLTLSQQTRTDLIEALGIPEDKVAALSNTLSQQTRTDLIEALGIPEDKVAALSNTIDTTIFQPAPDRAVLKGELGLPTDRPIIGGIASLSPQKNHPASIRMMSGLRDAGVPFYGIICGEGGERDRLEQQITEAKLGTYLELPGNKRPIHPWLQAMDLLVFPSTWEGQPMVLLQAMACEVPVIASDVEGNVATLGTDHPGFYPVSSDEDFLRKVRKFLEDPEFGKSLLDHQKERFATEPKLSDYVQKLDRIYLDLSPTSG